LSSRLAGCHNLTFRNGAFDVGLIQKDSIRSNLPLTLQELKNLYDREGELIANERRFFEELDVGLVVADIPAIPLDAAQRSGIKNIAIGNFSWDWIYAEYAQTDPAWDIFVKKFNDVYEKTDLLLRLPFAPPMAQFPTQIDIPLLAQPGKACRNKMVDRSYCDISTTKPWVLLSFTSLDLNRQALENIRQLSADYEFFCVEPLSFPDSCLHTIRRNDVCFADILASCDLVISKPGFGLVSECIVNNKPLIYSDRGDFAEYPYLVKGIESYLKNAFLPSEKLYAGDLRQSLKKIKTAPEPSKNLASGGADLIARELLKRF